MNMNLFCFISLASVTYILAVEVKDVKFLFTPGIICNFDVLPSVAGLDVSKYFCVPVTSCRPNSVRFALLPATGCPSYLRPTEELGSSILTCCHTDDILDDNPLYKVGKAYLPGLRSFMKCKDYAHSLCNPQGGHFCYNENTEETRTYKGTPSSIQKYPHTALLGHTLADNFKESWLISWFCLGSIISEKYILTAASCETFNGKPPTHVKVGEEKICHTCKERQEERTIEINRFIINPNYDSNYYYYDIALVELKSEVTFSKYVRPACLYSNVAMRHSDGWFSGYGQPEKLITTGKAKSPIYQLVPPNGIINFKVRAEKKAVIFFTKEGRPYKKEHRIIVVLGEDDGFFNLINLNWDDEPADAYDILGNYFLNKTSYEGFWIEVSPLGNVSIGRGNETKPFLKYIKKYRPFDSLPVFGVYSNSSDSVSWIFEDKESYYSLHDVELKVLYSDQCKHHVNQDSKLDVSGLVDSIMFCAGDVVTGNGPCKEDWGGAIQLMDENLICMWQIFGVFAKPLDQKCYDTKPLVFTNVPYFINWIENIVFPDFKINSVKLSTPACLIKADDLDEPGRC